MSKPKGKRTAYNFFMKERKEEHRANKIPIDYSEFSKETSAKWKVMTPKNKKYYEDLADQDKIRYEKEMKNVVLKDKGIFGKKLKKPPKDPNAPKRPTSSFFFFSHSQRLIVKEQNPTMSVGEVSKELGRQWKTIDPASKAAYEDLARVDRERYAKEIENYKRTGKATKSSADQEEEEDDAEVEDEEEDESIEMAEVDQEDSD